VSGDWGCGEEQRRGVASGEEGRRPTAVEFYSSSVSKELKGEEETGRRRFSGGSEGGSQQRTARRRSRRGGGADGSRRWELMEAGGGSRWKPEVGHDGSRSWEPMERRKWVE
jgi:hypothetical protein